MPEKHVKVRHVDFYADEWLAGTKSLSDEEVGFYIRFCSEEYSKNGPISREHFRSQYSGHGRTFGRLLDRLIALGKIAETADGLLTNSRCEIELQRARRRIEVPRANGSHGGRPKTVSEGFPESFGQQEGEKPEKPSGKTVGAINENNGLGKPTGPQLGNANYQPSLEEKGKGMVGRFAPGDRRDPLAYRLKVNGNKFNHVVKGVNNWASQSLKDRARDRAWEVAAIAESAGSWEAMPPDVRRELRELNKLRMNGNGRSIAA